MAGESKLVRMGTKSGSQQVRAAQPVLKTETPLPCDNGIWSNNGYRLYCFFKSGYTTAPFPVRIEETN